MVALQLKDKNENSDFALVSKLSKGKVNKDNFEECRKSNKPIAPIPSGSIKQMFCDKDAPEGTIADQVLETSSKFNYQNVLGELMYVYIACRPDIGYAITTLSKFSLEPSRRTGILPKIERADYANCADEPTAPNVLTPAFGVTLGTVGAVSTIERIEINEDLT